MSAALAEALDAMLLATADDAHLSRSERRALSEVPADGPLDTEARRRWRAAAFEVARAGLAEHPAERVLEWLEAVTRTVDHALERCASEVAEAHFSPGESGRPARNARHGAAPRPGDVCVFTITDDALSEALIAAHRRGVRVRVLTDDEKAGDRGSDAARLAEAGIPVRVDDDPAHMHHKFAIFDRRLLATGSYNWTRSAFLENQENLLVTDDTRLVSAFERELERLWARFG